MVLFCLSALKANSRIYINTYVAIATNNFWLNYINK